jgi:hypothetical protein
MTEVKKFIIDFIDHNAIDDHGFLELFKFAFNRKEICTILSINRNRYYYLVRTQQLDRYILKLRSEHSQVADSERISRCEIKEEMK